MKDEQVWNTVKYLTAILIVLGSAVTFLYANFATAADVHRVSEEIRKVEVRMIKQDIREIRRELRVNHLDEGVKEFLNEELADAIIDLCIMAPTDRECK